MISFALRVGPFTCCFDLDRDDQAEEDDEEPELLFHGEPAPAVDPRVGHLVR